jgi:cytochrome b6-f complex iron-sulfur subunit
MTTKQNNISRNEFLKSIGLKGAALMAVYCAGSTLIACKNDTVLTPNVTAGSTLLSLDISTTTALKNIGGFIAQNQVVIAKVSATTYVAVTQVCSHEGKTQVTYQNGEFYCTAHGARFDTSGKGLNGNGSGGIRVYTVSVTGSILTVKA